MNLLKEGIEQQAVVKTALTRKFTVDGLTRPYPVYKVRLDRLYNDQNDRIATWISQYRAQHGGRIPDGSDRSAYNDVIEEFIVASNPGAICKTQANIEMVDQREPGVVLVVGRIINGNRHVTCLRRLAQKSDRFGYFETVILDRSIENRAKQIKLLELSIQHGEKSKVDYNPIDRLVGIYNDAIESGMLSVEELYKMTRKCDADEAEDVKIAVFNNILIKPITDMIRFARNIKSVIGTYYQEEFLGEQRKIAEKVIDRLPPVGEMNTNAIREVVRANDDAVQALERSMERSLEKVRKRETRNRPVQLAEKATTLLESIDTHILSKMNDSDLRRLERQLAKLEQVTAQIREIL